MMLYCVCAWYNYYPSGGLENILYTSFSYEEALNWKLDHTSVEDNSDHYEILELPIGKVNK